MIGSFKNISELRAKWRDGWALRFTDGSWSRTGCYEVREEPGLILRFAKSEVGGVTAVCRVAA